MEYCATIAQQDIHEITNFLTGLRAGNVISYYKSKHSLIAITEGRAYLNHCFYLSISKKQPSFPTPPIMATAAVQHAPSNTLDQVIEPLAQEKKIPKHDVVTELNYYQDPGDGSLPAPFYIG